MRWLLAVFLCVAMAAPVLAQPVTVEVEGSGLTREEAVARSLMQAVEQVTGVAIQSDASSRQAGLQIATEAGSRTELSTVTQSAIQRQSGGVVRAYRVLSIEDTPGGLFLARLLVEVERFQPTSPTGETRRRLAVGEFRDEQRRETEFARQLRQRLIQHLTQSRRFAVLDRDATAAYDREMALLFVDAPVTERVRIGHVLGADYLVIGRLRGVGASRTEQHIPITGEVVVRTRAQGAVDFQVLEIATRQVRWAASASVSNSGNLPAVLDAIATRIAREITQTIYPMRLLRADNPDEMILNQGGVTVSEGQRFRAMLMGEEMIDPYTRESLGRIEREVGIVQVFRVDDRLSYARLVEGGMPPPGADVVLRLAPPAPPPPRPAAPRSSRPDNRSMFD
jgi:TolB-like protein